MTAARSVAVDPHSVRQVARGRAVAGLAHAHPELYRELYQQALDQARVELAGRPARQAHQQASRHARIGLKARLPEEYATRYATELAAIQPVEPPAAEAVNRQRAAVARLRALVSLAEQYPDLARQRLQTEQARLPLTWPTAFPNGAGPWPGCGRWMGCGPPIRSSSRPATW